MITNNRPAVGSLAAALMLALLGGAAGAQTAPTATDDDSRSSASDQMDERTYPSAGFDDQNSDDDWYFDYYEPAEEGAGRTTYEPDPYDPDEDFLFESSDDDRGVGTGDFYDDDLDRDDGGPID